MKTTLNMRTENFQEALETIKSDFITDLAVVDLRAKATRKEALAQQRNMEEKLKPTNAKYSLN